MNTIARRVIGSRANTHPVRAAVVAMLALGFAVGLFALGRATAPRPTRASTAAPVSDACGTMLPATMPSRGCQRILTQVFLGAPSTQTKPSVARSASLVSQKTPWLMTLTPGAIAAGALGGYALPVVRDGADLSTVLASMTPQTRRYTERIMSLTFAQLAAGSAGHP